MRWKPIVWNEADHYPQWFGYGQREGSLPLEGSRVTLAEVPGRTLIVTSVERELGLVWLMPVRDLDDYD
jgi:hypothetical protein